MELRFQINHQLIYNSLGLGRHCIMLIVSGLRHNDGSVAGIRCTVLYILYITYESICILGVIDPNSGIIIIITFYKVILLIRYAHQSSRFVH